MDDICKTCGGDKGHPKKIKTYVKGGRRLGIFNGDLKTGCYIDSEGHFIGPEGFALDEDNNILKDENGEPIMGTSPSYIDIEDYEYEGKPFLSEYEYQQRSRGRNVLTDHTDDGTLIVDYFRIYDVNLTIPDHWLTDEQLLGVNGFYNIWNALNGDGGLYGGGQRVFSPYQHHKLRHKNVQAFWVETYRNGEM